MAEAQVAFDIGRFESDFDDFATMLADFGTITLALDAYELNGGAHAESTMGPQTRTPLMVGTKYPFNLTFINYSYEFPDDAAARSYWEHERDGWKSYAAGWAESHVAALRPRFNTIIDPYPFQMTAAGTEFEGIRTELLTKVGDDFAGLEYSQSHWEGAAASNFFENFYNPLPLCVTNQAWVAEMLQNACYASKAVLDMGRNSASNTVAAMKVRVEQALAARQDAHSISATEFLTVASEILGLLDLLPVVVPHQLDDYLDKFQQSTKEARSASKALIGYAEKAIPADSTFTQQAATQRPEGLVGDFDTAIDTIETKLTGAWSALASQYLRLVEHNIGALEELKLLWLPRPDMASGAASPGDFHHGSSNQYT